VTVGRAFALAMACAALLAASGAMAQTDAPVDSAAAAPSVAAPPAQAAAPPDTVSAPPDTTSPPPQRPIRAVGLDRDRFEIGAAVVSGPFDVLGTFGYHRYVRTGGPFEQWVHLELAGGATGYLREGAFSVGYLVRPVRTVRRKGRIRPILELGPTGHLVVQLADITDFGETAFHSHVYLKTHGYAGFDLLLGDHWGLVARGRMTVPAHRPLDYAQIALFLR
jgi:hypothetical protein